LPSGLEGLLSRSFPDSSDADKIGGDVNAARSPTTV